MRVAALAFGILAGLVASLILALGGLDVAADLGSSADRQAQAIRFGLFVVGNIGMFGAALVLAAPLAGAIVLAIGAVAWVVAALLMHHTTDLVLILPPALLLVAAIFAMVAHIRRPIASADDDEDEADLDEADVAVVAAERAVRTAQREDDDRPEEVGIPAFAADQAPRSVRGAFREEGDRPSLDDWNPRRRQPPPPRTKPSFRSLEEEDEEEEEASGLSRFALGFTGVLSFGLYAALAIAALLIFLNLRNDGPPATTVAEVSTTDEPSPSTAAMAEVPSPPESDVASTEQTLEPVLSGEPIRLAETTPVAPSTTPSEMTPQRAVEEPRSFGSVTFSDSGVPMLADDFSSEGDDIAPLPPVSASPPILSQEQFQAPQPDAADEPAPVEVEAPASAASVAAPGQPLPRTIPPSMAALRMAPGTGPRSVASPLANADNTGL